MDYDEDFIQSVIEYENEEKIRKTKAQQETNKRVVTDLYPDLKTNGHVTIDVFRCFF